MSTTQEEIAAHRAHGSWRELEALAQRLAADAQHQAGSKFEPKLGGGTRLMLALNHRISHDIDLFIRDPQWIGYLTPRLNDRFETGLQSYSENAVALKLKYSQGEIDFIVGMSLLGLPDEHAPETSFALEPVAEVLAKKLFYRGWALTPRDLFDWWAIATRMPQAINTAAMAKLLQLKVPELDRSLEVLAKSPEAKRTWDAILAPDMPEIVEIAAWGKQELARYAVISRALKDEDAPDQGGMPPDQPASSQMDLP
jgi:hypothetical protein